MKFGKIFFFLFVFLCFLGLTGVSHAQSLQNTEQQQVYEKAKVIAVLEEGIKDVAGSKNLYQKLRVLVVDGEDSGKTIAIENGGDMTISQDQKVNMDDTIVVAKITTPDKKVLYTIYDAFRLYRIYAIAAFFFLLVIFLAGKKGIGSLLGLTISLAIIFTFIIPQILAGHDPLLISIVGSIAILFSTTFLAHGFSKQTAVAVCATLLALFITAGASYFLVYLARLTGLGSEEAYILQMDRTNMINIKGLLLGGIIIGTLGALNDITTTQSAAMFELAKLDKKMRFVELYEKGYSIGKEHMVSLVNTLILAYAGSSFAIFIFFLLNPTKQPYWVIINSELVSDEIIRTIGGSIGLVISVPLVTLVATWFVMRSKNTV